MLLQYVLARRTISLQCYRLWIGDIEWKFSTIPFHIYTCHNCHGKMQILSVTYKKVTSKIMSLQITNTIFTETAVINNNKIFQK